MQTNKRVGRPPKKVVVESVPVEVKQETVGEVTKIVREETDRLSGALKQKRVRRVFNGTRGKLEFGNLQEGYHYHLINDVPGRVADALSRGYEFVKPNEVEFLNVSVTNRNTDLGDKVRILVNPTAPEGQQHGYLMRILQEYYDEDMRCYKNETT